MPADRHLANLMMDTMLRPLQKPEDSVIVSIFTPCEMMQEVGLHPYNVEGFSCYLSAAKQRGIFAAWQRIRELQRHCAVITRHFLVQRRKDFCQKPKCIVYTNLTCDANLLTFRTLADFYQVPVFAIDVPWNQTTEQCTVCGRSVKGFKSISGKKYRKNNL